MCRRAPKLYDKIKKIDFREYPLNYIKKKFQTKVVDMNKKLLYSIYFFLRTVFEKNSQVDKDCLENQEKSEKLKLMEMENREKSGKNVKKSGILKFADDILKLLLF